MVCLGSNGQEKWRLVEDAWDARIKFALNGDGVYEEVERYTNETQSDPNGIMPDKEIRHRPRKDSSDSLFYSPSIRAERVETLRRICEMFCEGWKTSAIADRLNEEGIRPVYSDHWYAKFIDGLLENTVLIGKPAWNKKSRSNFRHIENDRIVDTEEEMKEKWRVNSEDEWYQADQPIFDPVISPELFETVQKKLQQRRCTSPKRSPKSEKLWLGGLFVCGETSRKLAGNSQGKHFRVNHPEHKDKKLFFSEAEYFVGEYLKKVGQRIDTLGEQTENKKLLEKLATKEWMTELKLDYIVQELEDYLGRNLSFGHNQIGETDVSLDEDDEGNPVITTEGDYVELYCQMTKDYMEKNRHEVQAMMEERDLLTAECFDIQRKMKGEFLLERYMTRIDELSQEIEAASSAVDYRSWLEEVQSEVELLRHKQEQVKATMERGDYVQKAEGIRSLIDRIVCHWERVPTDDKRFKDGYRIICSHVDVFAADGETMTIKGSSGATSSTSSTDGATSSRTTNSLPLPGPSLTVRRNPTTRETASCGWTWSFLLPPSLFRLPRISPECRGLGRMAPAPNASLTEELARSGCRWTPRGEAKRQESNKGLQRFTPNALNCEEKSIEWKQEVDALLEELGRAPG